MEAKNAFPADYEFHSYGIHLLKSAKGIRSLFASACPLQSYKCVQSEANTASDIKPQTRVWSSVQSMLGWVDNAIHFPKKRCVQVCVMSIPPVLYMKANCWRQLWNRQKLKFIIGQDFAIANI